MSSLTSSSLLPPTLQSSLFFLPSGCSWQNARGNTVRKQGNICESSVHCSSLNVLIATHRLPFLFIFHIFDPKFSIEAHCSKILHLCISPLKWFTEGTKIKATNPWLFLYLEFFPYACTFLLLSAFQTKPTKPTEVCLSCLHLTEGLQLTTQVQLGRRQEGVALPAPGADTHRRRRHGKANDC